MAQSEIHGTLINRSVPYRGPNESKVINASLEEIYRELALLREKFNTYTLPILRGLPSRKNDPNVLPQTSPEDELDIDAVVHGLDGTQIYTDNNAANATTDPWTGNDYDEMFYKGTRPRTVKEVFDYMKEELDTLYESVNKLASTVNTYISSSATRTSGFSSSSSTSFSQGNLQAILNNIKQLARDFYTVGEAALSGNGKAQLVTPLQDSLTNIESSVDDVSNTILVKKLDDSHIKSNAGISGSKISVDSFSEYTGNISTLQDALNKLATIIGQLANGAGDFSNWASLPTGPTSLGPQSLKTHISYLGHGGTSSAKTYNCHAIAPCDILEFDTVQSLLDRGLDGDLKHTFLRSDIDESLELSTHYVTYEYDSLDRMLIEKHYESQSGQILYSITYTYDGNTDRVTKIVKLDYRRYNRIPGGAVKTITSTYTYNSNNKITSVNTVVS